MAQVKIHRDGSVEVASGWQDIGGGARTLLAILVSRHYGYLPVERIRALIGDSHYPGSGSSGGSGTTNALIGEVGDAARRALEPLLELAGRKLGVPASQLEVDMGRIRQRGSTNAGLSWDEACALMNDTLVGYAPSEFDYAGVMYTECETVAAAAQKEVA